ncbi:lipase 2 [Drepanopeziza brunnea f. sp. 'multigermtubi' MB_m1]|uniref:Lipase 2 n=1 Tax=Marssonina brunnea f. sp. multigermtubi (strain MB_m1) TaxID=1072389 RepID=K1XIG1_MARBU|nr:lipase 2 [Drepanopeziza brunnea f. sp. 'multigermtubi' MB_m1]EKD12229.1 lipase 2 [Drepanopeziza brunnea f. sp. 'multigermtubi' MB_m1]
MIMTPEEHLALGKINPELEQILKKSPYVERLSSTTDIPKLRAMLLARKKESLSADVVPGEEASYVEEDRQIPVRDGSTITARIHKPKRPPVDGCPIFVVYHGGGFVLGGLETETLLCRSFTGLGGIAVNVDYRLAPEHPFPVPVEDAYDALKWTAAHFEELGGNPKKGFLVGGISAGGNFGAVLSLLYRDDKLSPPLTGSYLSIPACIPEELVPEKYQAVYLSREQNKDAPILNQNTIDLFESKPTFSRGAMHGVDFFLAEHYKPDRMSPLRTPIIHKSHRGLPPTYFQVCGLDPLRDEALIYEEILRKENGVKTLVDIYPGLPHGFWGWWTAADFSKSFQEDCVKGMKWLLEQSK